jgi:hypothetical protein
LPERHSSHSPPTRSEREPIIDLRLFSRPVFAASSLLVFFSIGMLGVHMLLPL